MLKKYKGLLIITSIVILLPILAGVICYDQLPDALHSHWGADGKPDGQQDKDLMIFLLPCILLAVHWLCILVTIKSPKGYGENDKMFRLMLWLMPVLSLLVNGMMYLSSAGHVENTFMLLPALFGTLFIIIGNYMPKTKQNWTMGIKIKWTLSSEENWYATHRLAGKLWVLGGALMLLSVLLPGEAAMIALFAILAVMVIVPFVYSWLYYKKQTADGKIPEKLQSPLSRKGKIASTVSLIIILGAVAVLMFVGGIDITYNEDSFTLSATFWQPLTVFYDEIDAIEYRDNWVHGGKVNGFNSARLLLGAFNHKEIGKYISYCYAGTDECVILSVNGNRLVIAGQDREATGLVYDTLVEKTTK